MEEAEEVEMKDVDDRHARKSGGGGNAGKDAVRDLEVDMEVDAVT